AGRRDQRAAGLFLRSRGAARAERRDRGLRPGVDRNRAARRCAGVEMLKAVDPTFAVITARTFQARNAAAYEVELLVAPSRAGALARRDNPRPVPLPEQEWLLLGRPVDQVV